MIEKFDCIIGTTTGTSSNGTFVELPDGKSGWIKSKFIKKSTPVMCTVLNINDEGFLFLKLDSVFYPEAA